MITRREFIRIGSLGTLALMSSPSDFLFAQDDAADERFFLQLFTYGGFDSSFLFDARPLEMTNKGLIHNYLKQEPVKWEGSNGVSTWATSLTDPLKAYKEYFSVCNGVLMAPTFDGHDQNANYFLTGNPFGGECFLPVLNKSGTPLPVDSVLSQILNFELNNAGNMVPMDHGSLSSLIQKLKSETPLDMQDPLWQFVSKRYEASGGLTPAGKFSRASSLLARSLPMSSSLEATIKKIELGSMNQQELAFLPVVAEMFKKKVSRTAVFVPSLSAVDAHDSASMKAYPALAAKFAEYVAKTLEYLKSTPYDSQRSLLDVTTVLINSEFARTMRQQGRPLDDTGTDHNNLTNTILIAGKGIKGGLVLGASDFRTHDEKLSGAHLQKDPLKTKTMSKPFDFSTYKTRDDLPAAYNYRDYLHVHSVINTIYESFGVSKSFYRSPERDAPPSPVLKPLLS